jgi:hypothetical protein
MPVLIILFSSFGGGFELMKAGGDEEGIWTLLQTGLLFVLTSITLCASNSFP